MSAAIHYDRDGRAFFYAVLASIALHGLLLASFPGWREAARRGAALPGPIVAHLAPAPASLAPARPKPQAPPRVEEPRAPVKKPAPRFPPIAKAAPKAPPKPAPVAPSAPAPSPPAAQTAPSAAAPQASAPAAGAATTQAAPLAPQAGVDAVDADSLGRFRMRIIEAATRFKRYPRAAMDNNWEGRADVRVTFNSEGRRASIVIVRSSGHEILDKQALDTLTKAFVPVPPALRGREFVLEIPVIYSLKENQ